MSSQSNVLPVAPSSTSSLMPLLISGQCVFFFRPLDTSSTQAVTIGFRSNDQKNNLEFVFTDKCVACTLNGELKCTSEQSALVNYTNVYYWISVDSQNQRLVAGMGEARIATNFFLYEFPSSPVTERATIKNVLESLCYATFDTKSVSGLRVLRDPIMKHDTPMLVKDKNELTIEDEAKSIYVPVANLSPMCQKMFQCVAGKKFILNTPDFPQFSKAIEHSIATPGCWCYEKLKKKRADFNPEKPNINETHLRITVGENDGESPGIPYVMEIWPPNHYSPVHNHAGANAIIRVLSGAIDVELYPFLSGNDNVSPFGTKTFVQDDITWISPTLNQVHKLINTHKETCITIQCYLYGEEDHGHYDFFDFINANKTIDQYEPDSDMEFLAFKKTMQEEWSKYVDPKPSSNTTRCLPWLCS